MLRRRLFAILAVVVLAAGAAAAADWRQFRGPNGLGVSDEKGLPFEWSSTKNIVWRTKLPGPGASSPVTLGKRIYITCYTGYAVDQKTPGNMDDLKRHLLCIDRADGNILWTRDFSPNLPEHKYSGEGSYHGYAASTPLTDGERLYIFFGKSGLFCLDLDGKEIWHVSVGKGINGWGSGASPMFYKDLVIVNGSVESGTLYAFDKVSGKEVWKTPGIGSAWNTPFLVTVPGGEPELVISVQDRVLAVNPDTGKELWRAEGVHRYVCPSVIAHDDTVYVTGGGHTTLAIRAGGRGDVTKTHVVWREKKGSNVASPIYHQGHLYWAGDKGNVVCQEADTGKTVYHERLDPNVDRVWASPILADGKLYYVTQKNGVFVMPAAPKFEILANNVFEDDKSRHNASIAVSDGQLLLRTDQYLNCIGKK